MVVASAAAEFAMLLRNSDMKGNSSFDHVISSASRVDGNKKTEELIQLAMEAQRLYR